MVAEGLLTDSEIDNAHYSQTYQCWVKGNNRTPLTRPQFEQVAERYPDKAGIHPWIDPALDVEGDEAMTEYRELTIEELSQVHWGGADVQWMCGDYRLTREQSESLKEYFPMKWSEHPQLNDSFVEVVEEASAKDKVVNFISDVRDAVTSTPHIVKEHVHVTPRESVDEEAMLRRYDQLASEYKSHQEALRAHEARTDQSLTEQQRQIDDMRTQLDGIGAELHNIADSLKTVDDTVQSQSRLTTQLSERLTESDKNYANWFSSRPPTTVTSTTINSIHDINAGWGLSVMAGAVLAGLLVWWFMLIETWPNWFGWHPFVWAASTFAAVMICMIALLNWEAGRTITSVRTTEE
jgi:hypothetical protein